jgi:hypothetical protein
VLGFFAILRTSFRAGRFRVFGFGAVGFGVRMIFPSRTARYSTLLDSQCLSIAPRLFQAILRHRYAILIRISYLPFTRRLSCLEKQIVLVGSIFRTNITGETLTKM